jgi:photosystem II stability/assembly factor-like uncharacterized protein
LFINQKQNYNNLLINNILLILDKIMKIKFINIFFLSFLIIISYNYFLISKPKFSLKSPKPLLRILEFNKLRYSDGIDVNKERLKAIEQTEQLISNNIKNPNFLLSQQPKWEPIGPTKIGGRVRTISWHPTNQNIIYIGAAAGGIWKTSNKGKSWIPIFDSENIISFGAISIDNNNPNIIYAGTGEMSMMGEVYNGCGIYKSIDGGNNWNSIGLTDVGAFSKIYVHPKNSNIIYAGGAIRKSGFYKSTDAGTSWTKLFDGEITDISINPFDENEIFIGVYGKGVYYSNDGGNTWELRGIFEEMGRRVSVQAYEKDFNIVYLLFEQNNTLGVIYKSTDKGISWQLSYQGDFNFFREQGSYNNFITIHPSNPSIVLAGGILLWRTTDGGKSWTTVNQNTNGEDVHVDQHCAYFNPQNNKEIILGNDGGVYYSSNEGFFWENINNNLEITQFYAMAIDYTQTNVNYGGTQDNGSIGGSTINNWRNIAGGDGFDTFVHPKNRNIIFGEFYFGIPFKYTDYGGTGNLIDFEDKLPKADSGLWHSPFIIDEKSEILYLGMHAIYASYDYGNIWVALTERYPKQFSKLAVSRANSDIIYAGNEIGDLYISENKGASFVEVDDFILPNRYVTDIETSYRNPNIAYASFGGFGLPKIFKTTNRGKSWIDISKNLPNIHVNCIAINPLNENIILAGTDIGVFITYNDGNDWLPFGTGLPRTPVRDLIFHRNLIKEPGIVLRAATHGRSIWEIIVPTEFINTTEITSPAGGEIVLETANFNISWYGFNLPVKIEYSIDDGKNWNLISESVYSNNFLWKIPIGKTNFGRIKITSQTDKKSLISRNFTISEKKTGKIIYTNSLEISPYGIAANNDNNLWVTDYDSNILTLIDGNSFNVIKQITFPGTGNFTDLAYNKEENIIYIHRLNENTKGGVIVVIDTNGSLIEEIISPAVSYPTGLTYHNNVLYVSDRDEPRNIYLLDVKNNYKLIKTYKNPKDILYGPRSMTYYNNNIHQNSTIFTKNNLLNSEIVVFESENGNLVNAISFLDVERLNVRGIDYDIRDGNYWISDIYGNIYKIANLVTAIKQPEISKDLLLYPQPAYDFLNIILPDKYGLINIYDILGNKRITIDVNDKIIFNLNINELNSGTYLIEYITNSKIYANKFIKY